MLKYKILPNKSQPVLCVLTMMLCNVYSKFSEADLLPSHWLQLSKRNGMECRPGKFMMVINLVENADSKWMQWTGAVAAWMWKWIEYFSEQAEQWAGLPWRKGMTKLQVWFKKHCSLSCLGGSAVFGCSSMTSVKHRVAEIALVIIDTGIQLLSLKCCWGIH